MSTDRDHDIKSEHSDPGFEEDFAVKGPINEVDGKAEAN